MGKEKKKMIPFWGKTADEKQNSATIMISVDRKGEVFPVKLKLQGNRLNKDVKKENLKKKLIEIKHQIKTTSDHSASSNNSFKPLEC